jgi:type VI secretion system secreted protein VgrG
VPDIIKDVLKPYNFSPPFEDTLTADYQQWEYCVQYRETDFNFISRLMEQEGIHYYFRHEEGKHTLVLADGDSVHKPFPDYNNVPFRAPDRPVIDLQGIDDWVVALEVQPGKYTLNDFDFQNPQKKLIAPASIERFPAVAESDHEVFDFPGEYVEFHDGQRYARTRLEELQTGFETSYGAGEVRGLSVGCTFNLQNAPRTDQEDNYLVVSTVTQADSTSFFSDDGSGSNTFSCSFTAIRSSVPFRSARLTPKPIIQGTQTAIVTGPKKQEIHTDKFGRIKVQFHWDRLGKADENTTCFIRVAQFWAGRRWGAMFIPRIGQEVVVSFLEGDPDQPLIVGSVYNGDQMPFYPLPDHKTKSTIKSNSSIGGQGFNEIRFEDKKDGEQVFIHSEKRMDVRVKASVFETNGGDRNINLHRFDDIQLIARPTEQEKQRYEKLRNAYESVVRPSMIISQDGHWKVTVFALKGQDLVRLDIKLSANGKVAPNESILERDLPISYAK